MPPRSDIEAMDRPTILYTYNISYGECATDKPFLRVTGQIFLKRRHFSFGGLLHIYRTSSQYVISYGCTITILYVIHI